MGKKKTSKKVIIIVLAAVVVIGIIIGFLVKGANDKPIPVIFSKVERRTITQTVSATGKIQPETKVKISPEVSGEIVNLAVKEGDSVSKNVLLARINPAIIETQLEQQKALVNASKEDVSSIKAQLENLEIDLNRTKELYAKKFVSKQELDKAQATYDATLANYNASLARSQSSSANLKQLQTEAAKTTIFAPIDGVVTSLLVEQGERVVGTNMMTGTEMMTVSDLTVMNAEVDVDENDIVLVKIGDTATIEIDALPNSTYKGVVIEVGHSASSSSTAASTLSQTTTFNVKIRLIDREPQLRPGMSCNVEIHTATHSNVIAVPLQSVTSREGEMKVNDSNMDNAGGGPPSISKVIDETKSINNGIPQTIVFIRKNNVATIRKVTIGISDMGYVEILSGLNENEEIISGSYQAISKLLAEGTKVIEEKVLQHK